LTRRAVQSNGLIDGHVMRNEMIVDEEFQSKCRRTSENVDHIFRVGFIGHFAFLVIVIVIVVVVVVVQSTGRWIFLEKGCSISNFPTDYPLQIDKEW
jgi:hypothetical protein